MSLARPRLLARLGVAAWLLAGLIVGSALLAKHVVALPSPSANEPLSRALTPLRVAADRGQWLAIHVLYAECRCSQRIAAHLLATPRPVGVSELVLWAGNAAPPSELAAHFRVQRVTPVELTHLGISAAPLLIALDPHNGVRYIGGYSARKQGPQLDDLSILASIQRGDSRAALPVFGCAVSEQLRRRLSLFTGL